LRVKIPLPFLLSLAPYLCSSKSKENKMDKVSVKIDRTVYKKLQMYKIENDKKTVSDVIELALIALKNEK